MYQAGIPQLTDRLRVSQPAFLNNFRAIRQFIELDHFPFDSNAGVLGHHKHLTLPVQAAAPVTAPTESSLFSILGTKNQPEVAVHRAGTTIPFTEFNDTGTAGWARLPSGILLKWGYFAGPFAPGGFHTVAYPIAPGTPIMAVAYSVQIFPVSTTDPYPNITVELSNYGAFVISGVSFRFAACRYSTDVGFTQIEGIYYLVIGRE